MCPDKEILSAYNDRELDSDWSSLVAEHVEECGRCESELALLGRLNTILHQQSAAELDQQEESRIRVWQGIMRTRDRRRYLSPIFRYLRMPIPALMLAALFCMGLGAGGMALLNTGDSVAKADIPVIPASGEFNNVEDLLSFLQNSESGVNITIQLPQEPLFIVVGEPRLLRAAEYRRGE